MAEPVDIRLQFKRVLMNELGNQASRLLLSKMLVRVDQSKTDSASLRQLVENFRVAVRMFVDVELAERLYNTLLNELSFHPDNPG